MPSTTSRPPATRATARSTSAPTRTAASAPWASTTSGATIVGDGDIDPLTPEALVYEPRPNGSLRLVGVEYVVFKADWDAKHDNWPSLFGKNFTLIPAGNRYGLPDFYELHAWIWRPNPSGIFKDWNPSVTCRGNGDPA